MVLTTKRERPYVYTRIRIDGRDMVDLGFNVRIDMPDREFLGDSVTHYTYKANVIEIIDGDTIWADIDLGFNVWTTQKLRFRGIDARELESDSGQAAKSFVASRLEGCDFIVVRTYWRDKFSRVLVDIFYDKDQADFEKVVSEGAFLNQELLDEKLAVIY